MKISNIRKRKAISPVLATVILIAITLVAAVAIAGFVFGLFGSFTSGARVTGSVVNLTAGNANAAPTAIACVGAAPAGNYVLLRNTGTANTDATTLSFAYAGTNYVLTAPSPCTVAAGGIEYISVTGIHLNGGAIVGAAFTLTVDLTNGGSVPISGNFN